MCWEPHIAHDGRLLSLTVCRSCEGYYSCYEGMGATGPPCPEDTVFWHSSLTSGSLSLSSPFPFFLSLEMRGCDVDVLFGDKHSMVTYSLCVDQL